MAPKLLWNVTLPLLIAFGTDHILWQTRVGPLCPSPYMHSSNGKLSDGKGNIIECCQDIPEIFESLHDVGIQIAVVYMKNKIQETNELLPLFNWYKYINYIDIKTEDPISKFERIHNKTGVLFNRTIYFDHQIANYSELLELGITCNMIQNCTSMASVTSIVRMFASPGAEDNKTGLHDYRSIMGHGSS